LTAFSF